MAKVEFYFICFIVISSLQTNCRAGYLPEGTPNRTVVCADDFLRASCPKFHSIAPKIVRYGTKLTTTCGAGNASTECCSHKDYDCFLPSFTDTYPQTSCTGRELCSDILVSLQDTSICNESYPVLNHYLEFEYYCIPDARISKMCTNESKPYVQSPLYLWNQDYPSAVRETPTSCSCAIETNSCASQIRVYFVDIRIRDGGENCTGKQKIEIDDNGSIKSFQCNDSNNHEITLQMTSSSNYITVSLHNPASVQEGHFWMGFEATDNNASLQVRCVTPDFSVERQFCGDCESLSDPANGNVTYSDTTYMSVATYSCNTGYTLIGDTTRTCQANQTWNNAAPSCVLNNCESLSDPSNGNVTYSDTTYMSVATYSCDTGYTLIGDTTRTCQANQTWTKATPSCVINYCESLSDPANGNVTFSDTTYMSAATYSCDTGYTLIGDTTRTCQANQTWTDAAPSCVINNCESLSDPSNGNVTYSDTTYMSVATYSCDTGHTLIGDTTRTCQANQTWNNAAPSCVLNNCESLSDPLNGNVTYSDTIYMSVATYNCDTGYTLIGDTTRTCQANQTWTKATPSCDINNCNSLPAPLNGNVKYSDTTYMSVATYSCDTGYTLNGATTRTCQANHTWNNTAPSCVINNCGSLSAPPNGNVTYSDTTYMSMATYSCDTGYTLNGATMRTCQANHIWNNTAPSCVINTCISLSDPSHGKVTYSSTTYMSVATYSCEIGYTLTGDITQTCLADRTWNNTTPSCDIKSCSPLSNPPNGKVTYSSTTYLSVATYTCNTGYTLIGSTFRICQADATWNDTEPSCNINNCGPLSNPPNGKVTYSNTTYLSVATYSCNTGYTLTGDKTTTCQADTAWNNVELTCDIRNCGNLTDPAHGTIEYTNGTTYQSLATFTCDTGYSIVGVVTRFCQANGLWSDSPPDCLINICGELTVPQNGYIIYENYSNSRLTATYYCEDGYHLTGPGKRECNASGNWSNIEPVCEIISSSTILQTVPTTDDPDIDDTNIYEITLGLMGAIIALITVGIIGFVVTTNTHLAKTSPKTNFTVQKMNKHFHLPDNKPQDITEGVKPIHPQKLSDNTYYVKHSLNKETSFIDNQPLSENQLFNDIKTVEPQSLQNQNIKGLHPELRPSDYTYHVDQKLRSENSILYKGDAILDTPAENEIMSTDPAGRSFVLYNGHHE